VDLDEEDIYTFGFFIEVDVLLNWVLEDEFIVCRIGSTTEEDDVTF
jgi:hypothetical protein